MPCPPKQGHSKNSRPPTKEHLLRPEPDPPAQFSGHVVFIHISCGGRGRAEEADQREEGGWGAREVGSEASSVPVCSSFLPGFPKGLCSQAPGMKGQFWQQAQFQYPCRRKFHSPALSYAGWPRQTHPNAIPRAPPIPASFHITAQPPSTWRQASRTPVFTILPLPRSPRPGPDPPRPSQGACWALGSGPHWRGSGSRLSVQICLSH